MVLIYFSFHLISFLSHSLSLSTSLPIIAFHTNSLRLSFYVLYSIHNTLNPHKHILNSVIRFFTDDHNVFNPEVVYQVFSLGSIDSFNHFEPTRKTITKINYENVLNFIKHVKFININQIDITQLLNWTIVNSTKMEECHQKKMFVIEEKPMWELNEVIAWCERFFSGLIIQCAITKWYDSTHTKRTTRNYAPNLLIWITRSYS